MYQTIYDDESTTAFTSTNLQPVVREMNTLGFATEAVNQAAAVFRDGDRYVQFSLQDKTLSLRLGVGSHDPEDSIINSMKLHEMIGFMYGGMQRGCHVVDEQGLDACLAAGLKDLKEFAHEFLRGDFRPFLRVLALKKREEREATKAKQDLAEQIYLA